MPARQSRVSEQEIRNVPIVPAATPRVFRQRRAGELRGIAADVLATATHHGLRNFVQRAVGQIDEADELLERRDVEVSPGILAIIDMDLAFAEYRLRAANVALRMHGPDVDAVG